MPESCRRDSHQCQYVVLRGTSGDRPRESSMRTSEETVSNILKQKQYSKNPENNLENSNAPFLTDTHHHRLAVGIKYYYIFPLFETCAHVLVIVVQHGKPPPQPLCSCAEQKQQTQAGAHNQQKQTM